MHWISPTPLPMGAPIWSELLIISLLKVFGNCYRDNISNPWLHNLKETLQYKFSIIHIPSVHHGAADAISHHWTSQMTLQQWQTQPSHLNATLCTPSAPRVTRAKPTITTVRTPLTHSNHYHPISGHTLRVPCTLMPHNVHSPTKQPSPQTTVQPPYTYSIRCSARLNKADTKSTSWLAFWLLTSLCAVFPQLTIHSITC